MYVLLLSSILVAGCLNAGTTGSSSSQPMNGPAVDAELLSIEPDYRESGSLREIDITAYHAMLDWNGSIDFAGWDVDLDGIVDYEVTSPNGITDITVDDDDVVESDDFLRQAPGRLHGKVTRRPEPCTRLWNQDHATPRLQQKSVRVSIPCLHRRQMVDRPLPGGDLRPSCEGPATERQSDRARRLFQ